MTTPYTPSGDTPLPGTGKEIMSRSLRALTLAIAVLALATPARAEIIVQNDSMPPVGEPVLAVTPGFRLGAWLDSPIDGTIVGVQILWGSELGGAAPSQEAAIRIFA
jgi:hypothetical protein